MTSERFWIAVTLTGLSIYCVVDAVGRAMPDPQPPQAIVVHSDNPHDHHRGGPGCDFGWTFQGGHRPTVEPRPLGVGGAPSLRRSPEAGTLRILTLNVHHFEAQSIGGGFQYDRVADLVAEQGPDVVVLQEVDRGTARVGGVDQAGILGEMLGMHVAYGAAFDYGGGQYGGAILSRWPIEAHESHQLPSGPGLEPRQAVAARVMLEDGLGPFVVLGVHLDHVSEDLRVDQVREVLRLAGESELPVVLAGDFNARLGGEALGLMESWTHAGNRWAEIDHVFVQDWRLVDSWSVMDPELDHPAVVSVLER